jgi:hypothetical protein
LIEFPKMLAAVELGREANRLGWEASKASRSEDKMGRWRAERAARAGSVAAQLATDQALAGEVLPAILGGQWARSKTAFINRVLEPRNWGHVRGASHDLFDHQEVFRRKGPRGPTTLENAALIGQPYNLFRKSGELSEDALFAARSLAERYRLSVWASTSLSPWVPGATALVIAARGLPNRAADYGFVQLARSTERATADAIREPAGAAA